MAAAAVDAPRALSAAQVQPLAAAAAEEPQSRSGGRERARAAPAATQPPTEAAPQRPNEPASTAAATAAAVPAKGPHSRSTAEGARGQGPGLHHALSRELDDDVAAAFSCHICLELAHQPVVTLCGHLFCWPCLYRWAQVQSACRQCPVCKAGVDIERVIPIYGRGQDTTQRGVDRATATAADTHSKQVVPPRPAGQRLPAVVQGAAPGAQAPAAQVSGQQAAPQQQGVLPALFGFQLGPGQGYVEALTPEQQHQAFLSRLLLMLGSFVIMCLLLF